MKNMPPPQPPQPTEFEKVSQLQVQGENYRKQMDSEIKVKQLEKDYQEMILKFETRIKELELQYGSKIDENQIRNKAMLAKEELIQNGKIQEQAQRALLEQRKNVLGGLDQRPRTVVNPNDEQQ
jgi:hypothetical protein